jgi:hypothetical protein
MIMKPNTAQLEILMLTNTSVSKRQLAEKKGETCRNILSPTEELEKQCWAGLLSELLPEVITPFGQPQNNYIWSIIAESNFIRISLGPYPQPMISRTALEPHVFLAEVLLS